MKQLCHRQAEMEPNLDKERAKKEMLRKLKENMLKYDTEMVCTFTFCLFLLKTCKDTVWGVNITFLSFYVIHIIFNTSCSLKMVNF